MPGRYTQLIETYCGALGIAIPAGFYRHTASRYAVVDLECEPPKLVARTWFKQEDVAYYIQQFAPARQVRILDFKEQQVLEYDKDVGLRRGSAI